MADTDDWGGVSVDSQPKADDWGGVPVETSAPKIPNMSSVQRLAQQNLSANDNQRPSEDGTVKPPLTPQQRLNVATGLPVEKILDATAKDTDVTAPMRAQYVKALNDGSAEDGADFMQSALHSIMPIVAGLAHPIDRAKDVAGQMGEAFSEGPRRAITAALEPAMDKDTEQYMQSIGTLPTYKAEAVDPNNLTEPEVIHAMAKGWQQTLGNVTGAVFGPLMAPVAPLFNPAMEKAGEIGEKIGGVGWGQATQDIIGMGMDVAGVHGIGRVGSNFTNPQFKPGTGPWDNLPGSDIIKRQIGKDSSSDVDQAIAQGSKDLYVPNKDFKAVSAVMGIPETALKINYKETGVKPDQVFLDSQNDPQIAQDISAGKVPEAYQHLVEEKPTSSESKMSISRDEATRSFTVVDGDGDHLQGGFDSMEEARHYIEDEKFKAEERAAIEEEPNLPEKKPIIEKTSAGEQEVIPGAERISGEDLAERKMEEPLKGGNAPLEGGLFDVSGRNQKDMFAAKPKTNNIIPPSESGKTTSLRTFLSNNGAKFNEANELVSIKRDGAKLEGSEALDFAHQISKEYGYLPKDESGQPSRPVTELRNVLTDKNGGKEIYREADADRVAKAREADDERKWKDPAFIEDQAHKAGIDTEVIKDETPKARTNRLIKALEEFYKNDIGSAPPNIYRRIVGDTILLAEKFVGKLAGGLFEKLGEAYIKTFQPELMGDKAKRADAFLAKYKASGQEAENAFYQMSAKEKASWDKKTSDERMSWLYDHETGRWNETDNPDHARYQALLDATFKAEKEAIGADADKGYKENYLPHAWENADAVKKYFNSEAYIKKYGKDGFTKRSTFQLIQDGIRAGFKLKTNNPESMLTVRLLAGQDMIRTMDLLHDMEGSGIAKPARAFSLDKRIAKTESAIAEIEKKYKKAFEKMNNPDQARAENVPPAVSKTMQVVEKRLSDLKNRLDELNKEKADNKLTAEQMKDVKGGFRVIGPDSKVWNISQEVGPLWKNAMESRGLWENQGLTGDGYRAYMTVKTTWVAAKLGLSLFHPIHVAVIHMASGLAYIADHLIQGGKFSDLALKDTGLTMGLTSNTFKGMDHPGVVAWKTPYAERTPEQKYMVGLMVEGGFKPTLSARDTIHFRENFDKAINGIGLNNLRLLGSAVQLPGKLMSPFFEHWIPGLKSEIYLKRANDAIQRDPSLVNDAGRRSEVLRQISKDTDRTYGEMNGDVQFWNKVVKDSFSAAYISGGWKLAQIYNARGLLQPANIAYKWAKTGEFSKSDITYNMLNAYAYTGLTLALGGAINAMLGNPIGEAKDDVWDIVKNLVAPKTGEKNPDGSPIRLQQPAFAKEAYMLARDINTEGLFSGTGHFLYHTTLIPGIVDTLSNRDFIGREIISDPTDLHQWMNAGWDTISPISFAGYEKADEKGSHISKIAGVLGFPMAGAYMNQTPFEQKVLHMYSEQNPAKGDVYTAKLKGDLKSATAKGDTKNVEEIEDTMREEGMNNIQISKAKKTFTKPFVDVAWSKLSAQDQKRLIESASEEEKKKFRIKNH